MFAVFSGKSGGMRHDGGRNEDGERRGEWTDRGGAPVASGRHSTGKYMDCVAEFVLRRKTRPGMPLFEYEGRPMKPT